MANTVIELRHSYVTGNVPTSLANGEIAINTYDGKLFYRGGVSNTIQTIERYTGPAGLNGEIQFNDSGVLGANANLSFSKTTGLLSSRVIRSTQSTGDEGGQLDLATAATNQSLSGGSVAIDIYQNKLRIFETGGTNRGVYIDLANSALAGVGTDLLNPTATPDTIARAQANAAFITANAAFVAANSAVVYANGAFAAANSAGSYANSAFLIANSAAAYSNTVDATQNTSITAAFIAANSAGVYANGAFVRANNSLNANTGGTITGSVTITGGNLSVTGNLIVSGNTITQNVSSLNIADPLIYLAANNYSSDIVEIGFAANYYDGSTQRHTGVFREASNKEFYIFDNYTPEPTSNLIDINDASFRVATLNANLKSQVITLNSQDLQTYINNSYNTANAAFISANLINGINTTQNNRITYAENHANSAFIQANAAYSQVNTTNTFANNAFHQANAAYSLSNTNSTSITTIQGVNTSQNNEITYAENHANSAFHQANAAYASANTIDGVNTTQNNSITAAFIAANSAGVYANGAFGRANDTIRLSGASTIGSNFKLSSNTGDFSVHQSVSGWTNSTDHPIIRWTFNTPYDDNLYFASGGNAAPNTQTVLILSETQGVLFGLGPTNPSSNTFPLTNEWLRINDNVLTVNGTTNIQSTTTSTSTITGALRVAGGIGVTGNVYADAVYDGGVEVINFANNAYNQANTANTRAHNSVLKTGDTMTGALNISNSTASTNTTTGALIVLGGVGISGALNATTKSFNIKHPTKEGKNLRYGSLEGPEFGVYVRGQTNNSIIELPDYWTKLVNPNTMSVSLTPIGKYQNLFVEKIENNKVYIKNSNFLSRGINCFYIIYGERIDVDKLEVET